MDAKNEENDVATTSEILSKKTPKNDTKNTKTPETRGRPKRARTSETASDDDFSDTSAYDDESSKKSNSLQKRSGRGRPPLKEPRLEIEIPVLTNVNSERRRNRNKFGPKHRPGRKSMDELRSKYMNKLMDIWNAAREIKVYF